MSEKITLAYIAKKVGVSKSAVSQALLGGGGKTTKVSSETAAIIRKAAKELNYRPNGIARSLSSGKTYSIGIMFGGHDTYYMELSMNIQRLLLQQGYIGIYTSWSCEEEFEKACNAILNQGVDGIITGHPSGVFPANLPIVLYKNRHARYDYVKLNSEKMVENALAYLISLGHHKIGFADDTQGGFLDAMKKFKLPVQYDWIMPCDGYLGSGINISRNIINMTERPTALIIRNDMAAIAAIAEFQRNGMIIPRDISIISFDNIMLSQHITPALTTFNRQPQATAELLTDAMIRRLENPQLPQIRQEITPELLIRASCSPIAVSK